jgi:hypothetical protein
VRGGWSSFAGASKTSQVAEASNESPQHELHFLDPSDKAKLWEYAVLVTNADYSLEAMGQLYRDRADCENGFDELKNQWGWGGYTTHDLERCNLSARAVALIYNWWSWYVRLAHPKARLEAITSRPMLLSGIARLTQHAGQSRLLLTLSHAAGDQIKTMITNIRAGLDHVLANCASVAESQPLVGTGPLHRQQNPRRETEKRSTPRLASAFLAGRKRLTEESRMNSTAAC